jgi:hypothetical protein
LDYNYDKGENGQSGAGPGLSFEMRFYPWSNYQIGVYWGLGLSVFDVEWEYDNYARNESYSLVGVAPGVEIGGKIELTKNLYIDPSLTLGYFGSFNSNDERDDAFSSYYIIANIGIVVNF